MPGITTNTTLLAAANQIVVALNELVAKPSGSQGTDVSQIVGALTFNNKGLAEYASMLETNGDTLNENITLISDAIEAQTTMQETRSIAEVTALNTGFENLITSTDTISTRLTATNSALLDINSTVEACCVQMQAKFDAIIQSIRNIRLQSGSGGIPGDGGGPYLDEPPIEPPPGVIVDEEACKRANFVYDYLITRMDSLKTMDSYVDYSEVTIVGALAVVFAQYLFGAALSAAAIGSMTQGFLAVAYEVKSTAFANVFPQLTAILAENKDVIICDLYTKIKQKDYQGIKDVFVAFLLPALQEVFQVGINGLPGPLSDAVKANIEALVTLYASLFLGNYLTNKVFDEADVDIEAYTPENPSSCEACAPQDFNGWWIPTYYEAIHLQYPVIDSIHDGTINPGYEIHIGQYVEEDHYPSPLYILKNNGTPETIDQYNGIGTALELISPVFAVDDTPATIIFTIEGGGDGSPGADGQWHYNTYTVAGQWSGAQGALGNGEHTITINDPDIVQAAITYWDPFLHRSPLGKITDIQFTNITVS